MFLHTFILATLRLQEQYFINHLYNGALQYGKNYIFFKVSLASYQIGKMPQRMRKPQFYVSDKRPMV